MSYEPKDEDYCSLGGHRYYGDHGGVGSCYCGKREFPLGGALKEPSMVTVPRDALVSVCDSLAEWANRRGELHDGLTVLLPYLSQSAPIDADKADNSRPLIPAEMTVDPR